MSNLRKFLSLSLSLSLLVTLLLPVSAAASAADVSPVEMANFDTIGWSNDDMVYSPPADSEPPIEALSLDMLEANDNLYRVREDESDLQTIVYRNSDTNLNTAYIFQHPVKYIDDTGTIQDINTGISPYSGNDPGVGLTDSERTALVNSCRAAWNSHLSTVCGFGCSSKTWPNPDFA